MKFLDLFAGIGGFRLGMESAGHECIGFCEIDKFARASYKAIHDTKGEIELHDATRITKKEIKAIGQVDVICAGFPCQPFSVAGARRGFEDTNGTLFFEIARFASVLKMCIRDRTGDECSILIEDGYSVKPVEFASAAQQGHAETVAPTWQGGF